MPEPNELTGADSTAESRTEKNASLDPEHWDEFRKQAHRMLDDMLEYTATLRQRPVWQPIPAELRARRKTPLPQRPTKLSAVHEEFLRDILPYTVGNAHPGFMGWVHGGGTAVGMLAEMLAAGLNANLGGRDQIPVEVEREVVRWACEMTGFPLDASGLLVTGTSLANLIAVVVAREAALGNGRHGQRAPATARELTAYASTEAHGCIAKGLEIAGLGSAALRTIAVDSNYRIDVDALAEAIEKDREAGRSPFLVVGTAGTVNTGAVDNLAALADLCAREKIWFHVDGAFGALARLTPDLAPLLAGMERADSLAFDFHKWGQVPYDAGMILVRDQAAHARAFALSVDYLHRAERGLAAGAPWPCDFGPDLSRGFRALKVWFTFKTYGANALGAAIAHNCQLARQLEALIRATPQLELLAPVELNIVCFRYRCADADRVNDEIVVRLQESGVVAPSTTRLHGQLAIRAAIVNHRTTRAEIDALVDHVLVLGGSIVQPKTQTAPPVRRQPPSYEELCAALEAVEQRLTAEPNAVDLLFTRGNLLELTGRSAEALANYQQLLQLAPCHRGALNNTGILLAKAGKAEEAHQALARAVECSPGDAMSEVNFANSLRKRGEAEGARAHFEAALRSDPNHWQAHLGMSAVLTDLHQTEAAQKHRNLAFRGRCILPLTFRGQQTPITVLELVAIGAGNTRFMNFLSDTIFQRYLVATEFYEPGMQLPPHQIVVNAIGDADVAGAALRGAAALVGQTQAPVINLPDAVLATGRCAIAERLAGLPGVVTAHTVNLSRAALAAPDASDTLRAQGFTFPLLLRSPGYHQGEHFERVENIEALPAVLDSLPGEELTVIEYLDASGADGKSRKYRVMMIDGQLYPLHAAVAQHWKIHYFSAEMAESEEHRREDQEYLENMEGVLGPQAMVALHAIQQALGLDYGGIDFGLNAEGDVLLFEANATMAVVPPAEDARWDYRRPAVARACEAVHTMLRRRIGQA